MFDYKTSCIAIAACVVLAPQSAVAQQQAQAEPSSPDSPVEQRRPDGDVVTSIAVQGAERLEPNTILSYVSLRVGDTYTAANGDKVLKELAATELFSNYAIRNEAGAVTITITENPVINRILLEGNKRIKSDKILPEIKLSPR